MSRRTHLVGLRPLMPHRAPLRRLSAHLGRGSWGLIWFCFCLCFCLMTVFSRGIPQAPSWRATRGNSSSPQELSPCFFTAISCVSPSLPELRTPQNWDSSHSSALGALIPSSSRFRLRLSSQPSGIWTTFFLFYFLFWFFVLLVFVFCFIFWSWIRTTSIVSFSFMSSAWHSLNASGLILRTSGSSAPTPHPP